MTVPSHSLKRRIETRLSPHVRFRHVRPFLRRRLTSLFGHRVADTPDPFVSNLYRHPTVAEFRDALMFLKENFRFVTLDDVVGHYVDGRPLPDYPIFLSFDDGFRNMIDTVAPILRALDIPATFFLTTDAIDNHALFYGHKKSFLADRLRADERTGTEDEPLATILRDAAGELDEEDLSVAVLNLSVHAPEGRQAIDRCAAQIGIDWPSVLAARRPFMTLSQCGTLLRQGFTLGAHGRSHTKFVNLDDAGRQEELRGSVEFVRREFGLDQVAFSYPHSHAGVAKDWMAREIAANPALSIFVSTSKFHPNDRLLVHRVNIDRPLTPPGEDDALDIRQVIAAAFTHSALHHGAIFRGA